MSEPVDTTIEPSELDVENDGTKDDTPIADTEFQFTALVPVSDDDEPFSAETEIEAERDGNDTNNQTHEPNVVINNIDAASGQQEIACTVVSSARIQSSESIVDFQVERLRRIVLEVGSALTKRFDADADFVLPATLDESATTELISELKSMVGQLYKEGIATQQTTSSTEIIPPESEWVEVNDWQPTPNYGLDSPIITHLLSNWTNDNAKIDFLRSWVRSLYMPSYEALNYPPGLHITNLTCVLRDGFMVLLIPLIRSLSKPAITVHVKKHSRSPVPVPLPPTTGASSAPPAPSSASAVAVDPFAQDDFLYDIRIKRLDVTLSTEGTTEGSSSSSGAGKSAYGHGANAEGYISDQVAAHNFHQQRAGLKHRPDYSPLAEINSFLPVIEAKTRRSTDGPTNPVAYNSRKSFSEEPHVITATPSLHTPKAADATQPTVTPEAPATAPTSETTVAARGAPVAAPSILQSIFSWWEPAPAVATAASNSTAPPPDGAPSSTSVPPVTTEDATAGVVDDVAKDSTVASTTMNISSSTPTLQSSPPPAATDTSASTSAVPGTAPVAPISAPANVNPVNKIAERLQQMRIQKQQQQLQKAATADP